MKVLDHVLVDLRTEGDALRATVANLTADRWRSPTPASGWDVATQIAHLVWTDEAALAATADDIVWAELRRSAEDDPDGFVDAGAVAIADSEPSQLLRRWDASRTHLAKVLASHDGKLPWFGPSMSPTSMATARLMETWAHALDVYAALGVTPEPTDRIQHVAHLGVHTRDFAFTVHGMTPPKAPFRIELTSPSGETWTWGPENAEDRVVGSAHDFCRLVTQRLHRADADLTSTGTDADRWLDIAQAFAGPPGKGREPGAKGA